MGNTSGKAVVFTDEVNLNHFRLLRVVGKGAFGKVRIVERRDTGLTFALKYIRKDEIVRSESVRNVIRERRMLQQLNHPFLCNLRYSFQDVEYLYIVVDLMTGGDLRFHICRKTLTEDAVRFWMAELACALRYIHSQGIVHRDVKPDNVLLDSEGHIHLADFNVASEFRPGKKLNSRSGTLAYLAPEVFAGAGYHEEVDWWSLGVTFYECIYNRRPFLSNTHEKLEREVLRATPAYPETQPPVSLSCVSTLKALLEKDISKRIGAISFESYTQSPFFLPIDFGLLEAKRILPIFVPAADKTNFDATYDLEELLLEEAPLEARIRRQKPRAQLKDDATVKEIRTDELHRMVETMFEPFDYTASPYDQSDACSDSRYWLTLRRSSHDSHVQSHSTERSHTPDVATNHHSSPTGSPPLVSIDPASSGTLIDFYSSPDHPRPSLQQLPNGLADGPSEFSPQRLRSNTRSTMHTTGQRAASEGSECCSGPSDQNTAFPAEGFQGLDKGQGPENAPVKAPGMLAFLGRKNHRAKSPKPREAGVLGKEGARVAVPPPSKKNESKSRKTGKHSKLNWA